MTYTELKHDEYKIIIWQRINSHLRDLERGSNLLSREIIQFNLRISDVASSSFSLFDYSYRTVEITH